jgi:dual specificity protein kinase YAK1
MPPGWMIDVGKQAGEFFETRRDSETGQRKTYRLKSREQYSREHNTQEQPSKKYFKGTLLPDIIQSYDRDKGSSSSQKVENQANGSIYINETDCRTTYTKVFYRFCKWIITNQSS